MKFYYNGKLVRTSKNHEYHYGVLSSNGKSVNSCHATREAAEKAMAQPISNLRKAIENCKSAIRAIENGKTYYFVKDGRNTWRNEINGRTVEDFEGYIKGYLAEIEKFSKCKVIELETR